MGRFFYPAKQDRTRFVVPAASVPTPGGTPFIHEDGGFVLVHVEQSTGATFSNYPNERGSGGIIALRPVCTHLGCAVHWEPDFVHSEEAPAGVFDCRCHGARFTLAGSFIFGPAPRSLDVFPLGVKDDGSVEVDTARRLYGVEDNSLQATPYESSSS
jgi:Rieske Fe-S protein